MIMTMEDIPAIAAEKPVNDVSHKYTFIPTKQVISDLESLGMYPVQFSGSLKSETARHLIRFREAKHLKPTLEYPEFPELVLLNSHDGLSSFQMKAGIFRLVCANGLVVAESMFKTLRIKHIHYSIGEVMQAVTEFAGGLPSIMGRVQDMKRVFLSDSQMKEFAEKAIAIRFPDGLPEEKVSLHSCLSRIRKEDSDNSVWTVLNVLQERILKGRVRTMRGKKIREIKETSRVVDFNQQIFNAALEYLN